MRGTYLYAVIAGGDQRDLGYVGLPDGWAHVTTIPQGDLAVVVSEYRGPALGTQPKPELLRLLTVHQRVIERAMAEYRVLPAKFGTLLSSREGVQAVLARAQPQLLAAFQQLGDTVEIEIVVTWDLGRTFADIGRQPEIAALVASIAGQPAEAAEVTRVEVGRLVKEAMDCRRQQYSERIMGDLAPFFVDAQPNALLLDEFVINVALLVARSRLEHLYEQVHRLDAAFDNLLTFRCIGPLPPYTFATLTLIQPCADEIDAARRLLQLGERASQTEINASHRRLAALCHPDRNPADCSALERFVALGKAHAQLLAYIHGQQNGVTPAGDNCRYDLTHAGVEVGHSLVIRRSAPEPLAQSEPSYERDTVAV